MLMERTQPVLERLSGLLGEPVITYWNSSKGSICQNDVAGLYALLRSMGSSIGCRCSSNRTEARGRPPCAWSTCCAAT